MPMENEPVSPGRAQEGNPNFWAPGTLKLEDLQHRSNSVFLQPVPTSDPNDPLNWSPWRKTVNFVLVSLYVLLTFVALDVGFTAWAQYQDELGFDLETLNGSAAANYAGLAVGCIFFLPIAHKYGRRPLYILSTVAQLAGAIWMARTETVADIYLSNVLSGLGGAISEALVQVTIVDLFFVHQHATMNGWYLFATFVGAYLGPVASGYVVDNQGWRWMWWWCSILFGINLVLILLFFEESKYTGINTSDQHRLRYDPSVEPATNADNEKPATEFIERTTSNAPLDTTIKMKPYSKRLAWITPTKGHIWRHFYQPIIILFTFPAITYTAITYGSLLAWFALLISIQADSLIQPPYNFTAKGVGLMNLAPFIASIPGVAIGGYLSDRSILWLARRNNGIYEPEMRLWLALPAAIIVPASLLMFGLGLHNQSPWPVLAVAFGIFGCGFVVAADIALSYAMDSYHMIIGDALVGVVFMRNLLSVIVLFTLTPWLKGMGIKNLHILIAVICFVLLLLPLPLLKWGKAARRRSAESYKKMALRQPTPRDFS